MSVVVCVFCLFCRWWKTEKHSCRSSVISMRSYPPQYPRSSKPLNQPPSLFLFYPPPPFLSFSSFCFPLFLGSFFFSFLSFFPDPPLLFFLFLSFFRTFATFFVCCVCVCVYLRMYVHAYLAIPCVSAKDNVKHIKSNIRYSFYKKSKQDLFVFDFSGHLF